MSQPDTHRWTPSPVDIERFQTEVLSWFGRHGRDLPWRRTRDPYAILVSELMLQQTQVSRVLPYYAAFLAAYPTTSALARAPSADVLRIWQGLGYNRRALFLQRAAQSVARVPGGLFPRTLPDLEALPGVGKYTARAIACFAFNDQVAVVETNVRRALRYFVDGAGGSQTNCHDTLAHEILPAGNAWTWNQAMIDFGAVGPAKQNLRQNNTTPTVRTEPFETTNRYWRGRILAALCEYPTAVPTGQLISELPEPRDEYRVQELLNDLHRDGLINVDRSANTVALGPPVPSNTDGPR